MAPRGVVEHADVGEDHRVGAGGGGGVDRASPRAEVAGAREGVDRHQHPAAARVGVFDALGEFAVVEVEAGIVARVGAVAEAAIDAVGAGVDRRAQRRRGAGGADQFEIIDRSHAAAPSWRR